MTGTKTRVIILFAALPLLFAALILSANVSSAADYSGRIKLGGVMLDEDAGDLSSMQETFNLEDGFSVSEISLRTNLNPKSYLAFSLKDINLRNKKGSLDFRVPGRLTVFGRFNQHRQVFDPNRVVSSERKNWRFGARATPAKWARLSANYDYVTRDGNRIGFPDSVQSSLGDGYDYVLQTGRVEGEFRNGARMLALAYDFSDYSDRLTDVTDRRGFVVSSRVYFPDYWTNKLTHLVRAAYGKSELDVGDLDFTTQNFQYTGVLRPAREFQVKYNFNASRIDNKSTTLKTDNFQNNFDGTYFYKYGRLDGGYGYETNDDDRSLTSFNVFRGGASFNYPDRIRAKVSYANRSKKDTEKRTLLQDSELATFRGRLHLDVTEDLLLGVGVVDRQRDVPDIGVEIEGRSINVLGRYQYEFWGSVGVDYTYSTDDYDNPVGGFQTESHIVTSRADFEYIENLNLAGGVTYVDVGKDLDIEKSIMFVEGAYRLFDDYQIEAKYNVYNYDDYVLLNRYYTANVVWLNIVYDFSRED